ncbi:MAG: YheU family protein [Halioglobus sp.]
MADFLEIPPARLQTDVLQALLEEFASRDGTDYGENETSLQEKVDALHRQLLLGDIKLLYDAASEQWDLLPQDEALVLLREAAGEQDD